MPYQRHQRMTRGIRPRTQWMQGCKRTVELVGAVTNGEDHGDLVLGDQRDIVEFGNPEVGC
jgi:hypothetical protein